MALLIVLSSTDACSNGTTTEPATQPADGDWLPAGEKPTLRQLNMSQANDYNTYPVAATIEELTGYHVEYDMLPADSPYDKLNLILASEENYDIIVIGGDLPRTMDYARQGALADLSPYMPHTEYLWDALDDYEKESFSIDGKLYAIGMSNFTINGNGLVNYVPWVRQDWMNELGIETPRTLDEFTDMLRAFKDYKGSASGSTIPFTFGSGTVFIDGISGAFGIPGIWNEVDGRLVYRGADPRTKDYLAYMKSLYQEGLIDPEYPANQGANATEKFTTGNAAVGYFAYFSAPTIYTAMAETQPDMELLYLPPLEGANGQKGIGVSSGGFDRIAFIPNASKNKEHAVKFMDLKMEPTTYKNLIIGEEGVHYELKDGQPWPIDPIFFDERGQANNYNTGRYSSSYFELWLVRNRKTATQYENWEIINLGDEFLPYITNLPIGKAPAFPETAKNKQMLDQMLVDQQIKVIAGEESPDDYDAFIETWMAEGGEAMLREYNDWWATIK
jgi:putative aldouronate transport system substrate-binding protein